MNRKIDVISCQRQYIGIGFIKSRKSDDKIAGMGKEMYAYAEKHGIKLLEVITDGSSGMDIDRRNVDRLVAWMEKDYIEAVLVKDIFQLSSDEDDLRYFLKRAEKLGVSVLSMDHRC